MIAIRRSTVKRARLALRILEKSAAAIPVLVCAARTVSLSRSSILMISAARMPLSCFTSASGRFKSRKTRLRRHPSRRLPTAYVAGIAGQRHERMRKVRVAELEQSGKEVRIPYQIGVETVSHGEADHAECPRSFFLRPFEEFGLPASET